MTQLIEGKKVAKFLLDKLAEDIKNLDKKPSLAVIIVGDDPASRIYVNLKKKKAFELGINSQVIEMPYETKQEDLLEKIEELNNDKNINAILVQLPLPNHIDKNIVLEKITPLKDVDCFHPYNAGKISTGNKPYVYPCTPNGILKLLEYYNISVEGKNVVVIGRSNIVGRPMAQMFVNKNATVTICHSKTQDLCSIANSADILVCAVGQRNLVTKDMVKKDAVVIDVGMNKNQDGKLCGDVDFENVKDIASFITPVPGGVGPMTICSLMLNTYDLFNVQNNKSLQ